MTHEIPFFARIVFGVFFAPIGAVLSTLCWYIFIKELRKSSKDVVTLLFSGIFGWLSLGLTITMLVIALS